MQSEWKEERILVTVKTYPVPSAKYTESSCTGGITEDGRLIRLFPIRFRHLGKHQQFERYSWIRVQVKKSSNDSRLESYTPDLDSLAVEGRIGPENGWAKRWQIIEPFIGDSIEELQDRQLKNKTSMGIIRPRVINDFYLQPRKTPDWTEEEKVKLQQRGLFDIEDVKLLEKVPVEFHYKFTCIDQGCKGHDMQCHDWETYQSYRKWKRTYRNPIEFEKKFLEAYKEDMINKYDTHFFMGTLVNYQQTWTIGGLFFPPKKRSKDASIQKQLPLL